jgi:hypothetical protein
MPGKTATIKTKSVAADAGEAEDRPNLRRQVLPLQARL